MAATVIGPGVIPTGTVQFFIGGIAVGTVPDVERLAEPRQLTVQQLVAGPRAQPVPVTAVYTSNTPNYTNSTGNSGLQVTREDARADYSGLTFFNTSSATSSTVNVILSATIRDITAYPGDPDAYAGDIRKARVKFVNRDAANSVFANCGNLTPVLVNPADLKTGTVSCTTTLSIGSADSDQFTVGIVVADTTEVSWYTRDSATDNTVVTVSKPLMGFITGGGYIVNAASAGQYAGTIGVKANYGFNVKNNKSGKSLQGRVNVIIRRLEGAVWKTYQIKSNAIDSLAQQVSSPTTGTAQFVSKANLTDITDPYNPLVIAGGLGFQMTITDRGEPGTTDSLAFTLWNGSTLLYSSSWDGVKTVEQRGGRRQPASSVGACVPDVTR